MPYVVGPALAILLVVFIWRFTSILDALTSRLAVFWSEPQMRRSIRARVVFVSSLVVAAALYAIYLVVYVGIKNGR